MHDFNPSRRAPAHVRASAAWLVVAVAGLAARLALPSWRTDGALLSALASAGGIMFGLAALVRSDGLEDTSRERVRRRSKVLLGALITTLLALVAVVLLGRPLLQAPGG